MPVFSRLLPVLAQPAQRLAHPPGPLRSAGISKSQHSSWGCACAAPARPPPRTAGRSACGRPWMRSGLPMRPGGPGPVRPPLPAPGICCRPRSARRAGWAGVRSRPRRGACAHVLEDLLHARAHHADQLGAADHAAVVVPSPRMRQLDHVAVVAAGATRPPCLVLSRSASSIGTPEAHGQMSWVTWRRPAGPRRHRSCGGARTR
jgi:hypothetical protein